MEILVSCSSNLKKNSFNIIKDGYTTFWLTLFSLFMALLCFFIPWGRILRTIARFAVYMLCGPWMKLVDIFYVQKLRNLSSSERKKRETDRSNKNNFLLKIAANRKRLAYEKLMRLRDFRKIMFGFYLTQVPNFNRSRFLSFPTEKSSAKPYIAKKVSLAELALKEGGKGKRITMGQSLRKSLDQGDMLLRQEPVKLTIASSGQPLRDVKALNNEILVDKLSQFDPYTRGKLLLALLFALMISLFTVPWLIAFIQAFRIQVLHGVSMDYYRSYIDVNYTRFSLQFRAATTFIEDFIHGFIVKI